MVWVELTRGPRDEADQRPFVFRIQRRAEDRDHRLALEVKTLGTMTAGIDYMTPPKRVMMSEGVCMLDVAVFIIDDDRPEGTETLNMAVEVVEVGSGPRRKIR